MLKPINFKGANKNLLKPDSMTNEECITLPVYSDGNQLISCWRGSVFDRIIFLFTGKIWLCIAAKKTHPPVRIGTEYPFE